jgi:YD repeat-containing protein
MSDALNTYGTIQTVYTFGDPSILTSGAPSTPTNLFYAFVANLNGDTSSDLIFNFYGSTVFYNLSSVSAPDLLKKIESPLGASISIFYEPAAAIPGAIDATSSVLPDKANTSPRFLTIAIGNTTQKQYDVFGRPWKEFDANGNKVREILYHDDLLGQPYNQYTEVRVSDDSLAGFQWKKSYFDGLGREYKTISKGYIDAKGVSHCIATQKFYNELGNIGMESNPAIGMEWYGNCGASLDYTLYMHDSAERPMTIIHPEGVSSNISYNGNSMTLTDPKGNSQTTIYDNRGRTLQVNEPLGSSVRYQYDALGRLTGVFQGTIEISHIVYDSLDRKTSMTEINSGYWNYTYDDAGNLTSQTDPKFQTTSFIYDELNRLIQKTYSNGDAPVIYAYDTSPSNGKGRIATITDATGVMTLNYDNKGNVISNIRSITNVKNTAQSYNLSFTYSYDIQNRLKEMVYPDGNKQRNYYSDSGYLHEVRLLGTNQLWGAPVVTYDGPGGAAEIKRISGNGVVTKIGFDSRTFRPTSLITNLNGGAGAGTGAIVQNLAYGYDSIGNITGITDATNSAKSETYTYDALNRLTSATSTMYGALNYAYDSSGNMTYKEGMSLKYGAACGASGLHAVCSAGADNFTYDANGNMIARKGRDLLYDAEDRLKSIQAAGVTKESYLYDFSGERTVKQREDGTVVYNVGMYEIMVQPNGTELHTKYVYGAKGDLAAQITKDSSTITLVQLTNNANYMAAKMLGWSSMAAISFKLHYKTWYDINEYFKHHQTPVSLYLFIIFALALLLYSGNSWVRHNPHNPLKAVTALSVILIFSFVFVFEGCSGTSTGTDPAVWTNPGGTPNVSGTPDLTTPPAGTWNDTWGGSQPIIGAYFFHPNHLGSVALIGDGIAF